MQDHLEAGLLRAEEEECLNLLKLIEQYHANRAAGLKTMADFLMVYRDECYAAAEEIFKLGYTVRDPEVNMLRGQLARAYCMLSGPGQTPSELEVCNNIIKFLETGDAS